MGDAYTTISDDENTLFYNPASLGRHENFSFTGLAPIVEMPDLIDLNLSIDNFHFRYDKNRFSNLPDKPVKIVEKLLGPPYYFRAGITPTLKIQHFALSFFVNSKTNIVVENAIRPELAIDSRTDHGIIMGHALTFGNKNNLQTSVGLAAKSFYRQGIDERFALLSPELLDILNNSGSDMNKLKDRLGYSKGKGYGFDAGIETNYYTTKGSRFSFGASILDIGDTKINKTSGTKNIPSQEMSLNLGTSWSQRFYFFDYTLAIDYSNMLDPYTPNLSKLKIGLRARFPILDFYWGMNGGYLSWGLGFTLFSVKCKLGLYGIEIGHKFKEKSSERFIISIDLLNFY